MHKSEIQDRINTMQDKLDETVSGLNTGPVRDSMKVTVPMLDDVLELLREVVAKLPEDGGIT